MFDELRGSSIDGATRAIQRNASVPQITIPPGHVGPFVLPGSGRMIWWTGRVAIGLRHERDRRHEPVTQSALWVQNALLAKGGNGHAAAGTAA